MHVVANRKLLGTGLGQCRNNPPHNIAWWYVEFDTPGESLNHDSRIIVLKGLIYRILIPWLVMRSAFEPSHSH